MLSAKVLSLPVISTFTALPRKNFNEVAKVLCAIIIVIYYYAVKKMLLGAAVLIKLMRLE